MHHLDMSCHRAILIVNLLLTDFHEQFRIRDSVSTFAQFNAVKGQLQKQKR